MDQKKFTLFFSVFLKNTPFLIISSQIKGTVLFSMVSQFEIFPAGTILYFLFTLSPAGSM